MDWRRRRRRRRRKRETTVRKMEEKEEEEEGVRGIHWKIITALSWSTTHKHEEIQDRGGSERKREALSIHSWIDY